MATIKLIALPGGEVQIFVDGDISYDEARGRTWEILAFLREQGVPLEPISGIEQHRDPGTSHVHVVTPVDVR